MATQTAERPFATVNPYTNTMVREFGKQGPRFARERTLDVKHGSAVPPATDHLTIPGDARRATIPQRRAASLDGDIAGAKGGRERPVRR
jgi:hypothetical protein